MPISSSSTSLTITNPLVLYRSLLATKKIDPDPAQHRLALHLQKLYNRLKDYEPAVDYKHRLDRLVDSVDKPVFATQFQKDHGQAAGDAGRKGILSSFWERKDTAEALALTKKLTDHESAVQLESPQGLLLYGEVGTGKSMLVDLLADCLPNRKKRRWHFNTFMLDNFAKLERLRRKRQVAMTGREDEHSLLSLARDMISTSPILFLDEFQLPDRASSKIMSNLLTSFFHLGGVLVATSNRMPEELASASGVEFVAPPASRLGMLRNRWGNNRRGKSESMFAGKAEFAAFLEVLRARCEIWDMGGGRDWRRREIDGTSISTFDGEDDSSNEGGFYGLQPMLPGNYGLGYEQSIDTSTKEQEQSNHKLPRFYFVEPTASAAVNGGRKDLTWDSTVLRAISTNPTRTPNTAKIPWQSTSFRVYGRNLHVPRQLTGVSCWTFNELCVTNLGPADYITLASNFHTFILTDVPILTLLHKNEARRLITLLDALYESRCKLLLRAAADPDHIFFPETQQSPTEDIGSNVVSTDSGDGVYPETFSEIYQDQTSPFRPNVSAYTSTASPPSYDSPPLPSPAVHDSKSVRSILADEDSDFGPIYDVGGSSSSRYRGVSDGSPGAGNEIGSGSSPDFARTGTFTGEDEKFAYKRAQSRLWEMCGARWWAREEPWWQPLGKEIRRWESSATADASEGPDAGPEKKAEDMNEASLFKHGASPFRTSQEPPPKISWTHAWGMMKWGRRAGNWGQGPEGLQVRQKPKSGSED